MGPSPKKIDDFKSQQATEIKTSAPKAKKSSNCFVLGTPPTSGLVPVSTEKLNKNGCLVLEWQPQQVSMLVSDAPEWYAYTAKLLKINLVSSCGYALALFVILVINRGRRGP